MEKARFFALLHFGRKMLTKDRVLRLLLLTTFLVGYNAGQNSRNPAENY